MIEVQKSDSADRASISKIAALALAFGLCAGLAAAKGEGAALPDKGKQVSERNYQFESRISREVLENYLSRAITQLGLLSDEKDHLDENLRMLKNMDAKFIGRAIYRWGGEAAFEPMLAAAEPLVKKVQRADPDMLLQACVFEIVSEQVGQVAVPARIFEEFGLPPEKRNFRYAAMLYSDGHRRDQWGKGSSVPDMSQLETRMWFVYAAARYLDIGVEGIHFGQVEIMDDRDPDQKHWRDMLKRVRAYAAKNARRRMVVCDAHVPSGGLVHDGRLMFDFHSFPLRIEEVVGKPHQGVLKVGYLDSIFKRSKGGVTPSGWSCDSLPYLAEVDNFGSSGRGGQNIDGCWCWGWDEISWFAHQDEAYRNQWLRYAWDWIRQHDPNGYLQMPGSRCLHAPVAGQTWYRANTRGPTMPTGWSQETTIKAIWSAAPAK